MVRVYPLRGMVLRLAQQHLNRQLSNLPVWDVIISLLLVVDRAQATFPCLAQFCKNQIRPWKM